MKKLGVLILILIFILPAISAVEINMNSNFLKGETIISSVEGNFLSSLTKSNIKFYRGYVQTSFDYDVARIGNVYYIYVQTAGKTPGNYSINISGVNYLDGSQVSSQQFSKVFTIKDELADFYVSPGFVITSGDFSLKIQNLKNSEIQIKLSTKSVSADSEGSFKFLLAWQEVGSSIILRPNQTAYLAVQLDGISKTTIKNILMDASNVNYVVPVYVILSDTPSESSNDSPSATSTDTTPTNTTETIETEIKTCSWLEKLFGCEDGVEPVCKDTCSSLNYQCGTRTVCGVSVNCGTCKIGYNCQVNGTCIKSPCKDTCASLNYQCGIRKICDVSVNCGTCPSGYSCSVNGTCMKDCTLNTCLSLGKSCGTWSNGCGGTLNCGTCVTGYNCQTNGTCIKSLCKDTCSSLKYQCGIRTICGANVNCGTCPIAYNCQVNGTCIKDYTEVQKNTSVPTTNLTNKTGTNVSNVSEEEDSTSILDIFKKKETSTDSSEEDSVIQENILSKTCEEVKGKICPQGQICANRTVLTKDANCCISFCVKEEENPKNKIIGWAIIGFLFLLILWFFRIKFKDTKTKKDLLLNPQKK